MAFFVTVLRSGSKGNATLVETPTTRLLIDCGGKAARDLETGRLRIDIQNLNAVVVSHAHQDHFGPAAFRLVDSYGIRVYLHRTTYRAARKRCPSLRRLRPELVRHFAERAFRIGDLSIAPFPVSHGSWRGENIGRCFAFIIRWRGPSATYRLAYVTDLGIITPAIVKRLLGCHCLVLEANHDVAMARKSVRPPYVIDWVLSDKGHLSNDQAAEAIADILRRQRTPRLRNVVLAHLSQECNVPDKAKRAIRRVIRARDIRIPRLFCAMQSRRMACIRVDSGRRGSSS